MLLILSASTFASIVRSPHRWGQSRRLSDCELQTKCKGMPKSEGGVRMFIPNSGSHPTRSLRTETRTLATMRKREMKCLGTRGLHMHIRSLQRALRCNDTFHSKGAICHPPGTPWRWSVHHVYFGDLSIPARKQTKLSYSSHQCLSEGRGVFVTPNDSAFSYFSMFVWTLPVANLTSSKRSSLSSNSTW
ncbi:hypothetical protein BJV78DRAFT_359465 [Lactifluus subvellereus]|nr:hypothetical protein BJV78DRAFT_359465 [Lactifluus subvellereus]